MSLGVIKLASRGRRTGAALAAVDVNTLGSVDNSNVVVTSEGNVLSSNRKY